ncbi:MAG TPA: hypothetical protein VFX96_13480 [Pyrinomonadaceae bacterium]|nr:hypothetical protein [Pyrinomonadaceae bacterium]
MGTCAEQRMNGGRRAPVSALALLALLAHAFVITTLHAHPRALVLNLKLSSDSRTLVRDERPDESSPGAGRHAQCLLCNLQRDFVTDLDAHTPATAAPSRPCARPATREARAHAEESHHSHGGRAPPATQNS